MFVTAIYSNIEYEQHMQLNGPFESEADAIQFVFMHLVESGTLKIQFNDPLGLNKIRDDLMLLFAIDIMIVTTNNECNQVISQLRNNICNRTQLNNAIELLYTPDYVMDCYYYGLKHFAV